MSLAAWRRFLSPLGRLDEPNFLACLGLGAPELRHVGLMGLFFPSRVCGPTKAPTELTITGLSW